jgi:transposase
VTRLGALTLAVEVADWRRFATDNAFMGFCGLVPSEHSSGNTVHRGRLTKAGNAHLRRQLLNSAWAYQHHPRIGAELGRRQQGLDPEVVARAWAAQQRLSGRFWPWLPAGTPRASKLRPSPGSSPGASGPR